MLLHCLTLEDGETGFYCSNVEKLSDIKSGDLAGRRYDHGGLDAHVEMVLNNYPSDTKSDSGYMDIADETGQVTRIEYRNGKITGYSGKTNKKDYVFVNSDNLYDATEALSFLEHEKGYNAKDINKIVKNGYIEGKGAEALYEVVKAIKDGKDVTLGDNEFIIVNDKSTEEHFKEEPEKVEIPKDGYSSWIADRQIINNLTKLTEEERKAKLANGEISQRQYNSVKIEIEKGQKLEETITKYAVKEAGDIHPAIGKDGIPLGIEECKKMYEENFNPEKNPGRDSSHTIIYVKETGQIIGQDEILRIPEGETYTVYAIFPNDLGTPTITTRCVIGTSDGLVKAAKKHFTFDGRIW